MRLLRIIMPLLLALIGNLSYAQNDLLNLQETSGKTTAWMKKVLALKDSQVPLAEDINVQYECSNLVLRSHAMNRKRLGQIAKCNEQKRDEALRDVLTPEQFNTWLVRKKEIEMINGKHNTSRQELTE